jgi:hypothetical protein
VVNAEVVVDLVVVWALGKDSALVNLRETSVYKETHKESAHCGRGLKNPR